MPLTSTEILTSLHQNGYIHLSSLIPRSHPLFSALLRASQDLTARARAGSWPYVRTVPKQFPPWNSTDAAESGIWGVQHLLHPDLPAEERGAFAAGYFADEILDVVRVILGIDRDGEGNHSDAGTRNGAAGEEQLVMELFNLLVTPGTAASGSDFQLRWHRDDIPASVTGEAEEAALGLRYSASGETKDKVYTHTQFNLSLSSEDDTSLILVPGSHARARTAEEVSLMAADAYAVMPGQVTLTLRAGDVVFYDNNILHRAVYRGDRERWTLHGSYSRLGAAQSRARNVLQHGVGDWIGKCTFECIGLDEKTKEMAEGMKKGLIRMGEEGGWRGEYSLQG